MALAVASPGKVGISWFLGTLHVAQAWGNTIFQTGPSPCVSPQGLGSVTCKWSPQRPYCCDRGLGWGCWGSGKWVLTGQEGLL